MLRKLSCCPAKDASGRSSAVADDLTAKVVPSADLEANDLYSKSIACSRALENGVFEIHSRIFFPLLARDVTSSMSRPDNSASIFSPKLLCKRNSLNASAVVAKPVGTLTPFACN